MATISRNMLVTAAALGSNLHRNEFEFVSRRMFDLIGDALKRGEPVGLSGFGCFQIRPRSERKGRNPRTGEEHPVARRETVVFIASKKLHQRLR